jgi:hypothetical protein
LRSGTCYDFYTEAAMTRFCVAVAIMLGCAVGAASAQTTNAAYLTDGRLKAAQTMDATGAAAQAAAVPNLSQDARLALAAQIVKRWARHAQKVYKVTPQAWSDEITALFKVASPETIQDALNARQFEGVIDAIHPDRVKRTTPAVSLKTLGDIAGDLVYVPVTPCRIFDTRVAGGVITGTTVRNFDVTAVSDYSFQGGDASNCGGTGSSGSFAAAAINFTVVNSLGSGYLVAYPFLGTQPFSATMVFGPNDLISNLAIVRLDQGASANEMSVYTSTTTHLVGDIVGYFINPQATQLDCVEVSSAGVDIAAGGTGSQSTASCPTGYEITGGGCSSSTFDGKIVTSRSFDNSPTSQSHFCAFRNQGSGTANFVAYGRCCRVPGR